MRVFLSAGVALVICLCASTVAAGSRQIESGPSTFSTSVAGSSTFTVPECVSSIAAVVVGAGGGSAFGIMYGLDQQWARGGHGGRVTAEIAVSPGQVLQLFVGGGGHGFTGGYGWEIPGGGGGSSSINPADLSSRVIAGGGGGALAVDGGRFYEGGDAGQPDGSGGSGSGIAPGLGGHGGANGIGGSAGSSSAIPSTANGGNGTGGDGGAGTNTAVWTATGGIGFAGGGNGGTAYTSIYSGGGSGGGGGYGGGGAGREGSGGAGGSTGPSGVTYSVATNGGVAGGNGGDGSITLTYQSNCSPPSVSTLPSDGSDPARRRDDVLIPYFVG